MARTIRECIGDIAKAGKMTKPQAKELLEELEGRTERSAREQGLTAGNAVRQAAQDLKDSQTAAAAIEKRNQLLNLQKRIDRRQRIEDIAATLKGDIVINALFRIELLVQRGRNRCRPQYILRATASPPAILRP
jgi:polyhydroxyalkanoate synthesis regulator phasin